MNGSSTRSRLRCPDCFGGPLSPPPDGTVPGSVLVCPGCARQLPLERGVLHALPAALGSGSGANLAYYDRMAEPGESHLDRRGRTRNHRTKLAMVTEALGLAEPASGLTVLELGTGSGTHGARVVEMGHDYTAVDISPSALERAAQTHPALAGALLVSGDATRLPFEDQVFERVFCVGTLHHLPEPLDGVAELIRVLAPGGRYCFLEPRRFHPAHFLGYLRNPGVEVGTLRTGSGRLKRALRHLRVSTLTTSRVVFTPNGPSALVPLYDLLDRLCRRVPGLDTLSVMQCLHGTK